MLAIGVYQTAWWRFRSLHATPNVIFWPRTNILPHQSTHIQKTYFIIYQLM